MAHSCPQCGGDMIEITQYDSKSGDEIPTGTFQCRTPSEHPTVNQGLRNSVREDEKNRSFGRGKK